MPVLLDATLDRLKSDPNTLSIYSSRLRLKKTGNSNKYRTNCPFHPDSTPSFDVYLYQGVWIFKCLGCGVSGNVVQFVAKKDGISFSEALEKVKHEIGQDDACLTPAPEPQPESKPPVVIPLARYADAERELASNQTAKDWLLNERGITFETAQKLHFGYRQSIPKESRHEKTWGIVDQGWITIPCINGSQVDLIKYRSIARKVFTRRVGMRSTLFNTATATPLSDLYLVSGDFDAAVLEQAGFHAISLQSDTVISDELVEELQALVCGGRFILAGDNDSPGQKVMKEIQAKVYGSLLLQWPTKDANELWLKHRNDLAGFKQIINGLTKQALPAELPSPEAAPEVATELTEDEDREALDDVPVCPSEIIDGDYIGDLTRILTDGTFIPPEYVRENLKTILGAMIDGEVGFPAHEDIHLRQYNINISFYPRTGKGESWKRTGDNPTGVLAGLLAARGIQVVDGSGFGSGEFMVKKLTRCAAKVQQQTPTARADVLARFDEMAEPFEKAKATGSSLESKFLQLFERNSSSQGSFKNGEHEFQNLHFSLSGDFTRDGFERAFAGRGSGGSGFLARCIYSYSKRGTHEGDWAPLDLSARLKIVTKIDRCLNELPSNPNSPDDLVFGETEEPLIGRRFIPMETEEAKQMRLGFFQELSQADQRYTPEIETLLKRDLLLRAIFSDDQVINETRTGKAILWARRQLTMRQLLWPEESGSLVEMMERKILKALADTNLSRTQLIKHCNVNRPGSGGRDVFNRALNGLLYNDIRGIGRTQRNTPIYSLSSRQTRESLGSQP
jgi:hypothetical protein